MYEGLNTKVPPSILSSIEPNTACHPLSHRLKPLPIKTMSIELLSINRMSIEPLPIDTMFRMYNFIEPLPINNAALLPSSITNFRTKIESIIKQFWISEFVVAILSVFEASESKALNTHEKLSVFCNEVARAVTGVWCLGWIGHMFVTAMTESPRQALHDDVTELVPVYHIPSKTFDEKMDGYVFMASNEGLGYHHNGNLEILKMILMMERLHQDYIATKKPRRRETKSRIFFLLLLFLIKLGLLYAARQWLFLFFVVKTIIILTKRADPSRREHLCWLMNQKFHCLRKTLINFAVYSICVYLSLNFAVYSICVYLSFWCDCCIPMQWSIIFTRTLHFKNTEVIHRLSHVMVCLTAHSFICLSERKFGSIKDHKYMLE